MSSSVMCQVLGAPEPRGELRLVQLMIADNAGEYGSAIIDWEFLARRCAMSEDALRDAVSELIEEHYLALALVGVTLFHFVIPDDEAEKAKALELGLQEIKSTTGNPTPIGWAEEIAS